MSFSLYKIILLLTVSVFYTVSSCREVLHADNVNNIQIGKDDVFTKPEQMKNTIVVDGNGRVKTGGIPEDISKIIDTANDAVKKYGNKEGKAVIIINENEVSQQQKSGENDEKKDSNDDSKKTKQKRRIVVDKVILVEKSGRIQPFTVVDESGEYLIEFKKPANVECNNACNNPFDKIVAGFQKGNNESSKKSSVKQSNSSNKTSKTVVKNKQTVKKSVNNGKKVANTKQNGFVKKLNRADKIVYTNNSDYQYNTNRKTKQDDFDDRMDGIEQIHCIGGCKKKQKSQQQKKTNPTKSTTSVFY